MSFGLYALSFTPAIADNSFAYAPGEQEIYRHIFDTTNGWEMDNGLTFVANGELLGVPNTNWMKATHWFEAPLAFDEGELNAYWSLRTDAAQGEDGAAVYFRLNLTNTPGLIEQFNFTLSVRPGQFGGPPLHAGHWYLYVDPGYFIPHTAESDLQPAVSFLATNQWENFRLRIRKTDTNTVELTPFWWNRTSSLWEQIAGQSGSASPLIANIATQMDGLQSLYAVELQFYQATPAVDAVAVTRREPAPRVTKIGNAGGALTLDWTGGNAPWLVERSTNLALPAGGWTAVRTNQTNTGTFSVGTTEPRSFYRIRGQ
ncbi:MAG: hypothetical protein HY301_11055 [Verrucomicrobia bacterium]|nr:hypothetical protein [Verrucomicrobiota bacterium]